MLIVTHHGDRNRASPRLHVTFEMEYLLPRAQHGFAVLDRNGERRAKQRRLQMGMAVPVVPRAFVTVIAAGRNQFVQHRGQVLLEARLEFDRANRARAADVENMRDADAYARFTYDAGNVVCEVVHIFVTSGLNLDFTLVNHTVSYFMRGLKTSVT